jgi:hypothetical protein
VLYPKNKYDRSHRMSRALAGQMKSSSTLFEMLVEFRRDAAAVDPDAGDDPDKLSQPRLPRFRGAAARRPCGGDARSVTPDSADRQSLCVAADRRGV